MTLFLLENALDVNHGGVSLPLEIDFSDYIPVETFDITVSLADGTKGFGLSNLLSDLSVSSDEPKAILMFSADITIGDIADQTTATLTLGNSRIKLQPNEI